MSSVNSEPLKSLVSREEDLLVKNMLLTHDPDGRQIDTQTLLRAMENVMLHATMSSVSATNLEVMAVDNGSNSEAFGSNEAVRHAILCISYELLQKRDRYTNLHLRTMALFDLLGNYTWDAKVVLVLAAFATSYGEFWLLVQLYPLNPLAVSVAMLKQLPNNLSAFKLRFKALRLLVNSMVDVTKCIIEFEGLRLQNIKLEGKAMFVTSSQIYIAAYWVIRSALTCSSLITDLIAKNHENSTSTTTATWEFSSLLYKLGDMCGHLRKLVDMCDLQIKAKVNQRLLNLFKEPQIDNQNTLSTLLALKDDMPLKCGSLRAKLSVHELVNKVVVLLISKPDILPLEELLFLIKQTTSLPHHDESERSYSIVWVPISSSDTWNDTEVEIFNHLSNKLPWYFIRQPWLLSSTVVNFMKHTWHFVDEPLMVALNSQGTVTSFNALHMVFIWGAMAYPFSTSRERQLWQVEWNLGLITDEIDPLLSMQVEEGRTICLYGSNNLNWIREFTTTMKKIISTGIQIQLVYVGNNKPGQHIKKILATIAKEKLSNFLSVSNIHVFWLRLERMWRSKLQLLQRTCDNDCVFNEVVSLLSHEENSKKGWAIIGSRDTAQLYEGEEVMNRLQLFTKWGERVEKRGFLGAIRSALEQFQPVDKPCCNKCNVVPYNEGFSTEGGQVCDECNRPMQRFIMYQCQGTGTGTGTGTETDK